MVGYSVLIKVRNIVIYASRCKNSLRASSLVTTLFPKATYHLVSIVPRLISRFTYTHFANELFENISRESLTFVEKVLISKGISPSRKSIVEGDIVRGLSHFARSVEADLLVMGASTYSFITNVVVRIIEKIGEVYRPLPTLIYTSRTKDITDINEVIAILRSGNADNTALHIASKIAYKSNANLNIILLTRLSHDTRTIIEKYLSTYNIRASFTHIPSNITNIKKYLDEITSYSDILVLEMRKVRRPWMKSKVVLTELCREVLLKSSTPLVLS